MIDISLPNNSGLYPGALLAAWSPEVMAISGTLILVFFAGLAVSVALRSFDHGVSEGKLPSKAKSRFYNQVIGWIVMTAIAIALIWVFDTWIYERLPRLG